MSHVVIIGNGISGVTAARHIRKQSDKKITIISSETEYFYSRTALMYIYMGHMKFEHTQPYEKAFWKKNHINLKKGLVKNINFESKILFLSDGKSLSYDQLILALGSKPNKFGWKGEDSKGVQGLYHIQDLEQLEQTTKRGIKRGVIVGGGLIGIELAEMLHSRNIQVSFLVRESSFWGKVLPKEESELINQEILKNKIDLRLSTELKEIISNEEGWVKQIITTKGEKIDCDFVGLTVGVSPNIHFLKESELNTNRGIIVNRFLETSQKSVYAIGDCAEFEEAIGDRRKIEQVWYTGRMMGEAVANTICGNKTAYSPSYWFNSAKFFDIEYQTYGSVHPELQKGQSDFYWKHPKSNKCLHFVYESESRKFIGVNALGVRLRHHCFDDWLTKEKSIEYVLEHLKDANFDPEFYKSHEKIILQKFNHENNTHLIPKKKSWKRLLGLLNR